MMNDAVRGVEGSRWWFCALIGLALVVACPGPLLADTITFTSNTTIACSDFTYDGHDIIGPLLVCGALGSRVQRSPEHRAYEC